MRFHPLGSIQVVFADVGLWAGIGVHRLTLPLRLTANWLNEGPETTPALLTGSIWTASPSFRWLGAIDPQVVALRGYLAAEDLTISVSDDQLLAIDLTREGGDLRLHVKLAATLLQPPTNVHPIDHAETDHFVTKSRWIDLLDQAGGHVGITIRVPSPLMGDRATAEASWSQAATRLRQARTHLQDGQWELCVGACRQALESVGRLVSLPSVKSLKDVAPEARSQEQRWAAIYYDVKSMTSAAHHDDGTTASFLWTSADAEGVLASTAGLLRKFGLADT